MKIGLGTLAYNAGGHTSKQLDSILSHSKHDIEVFLFLHNSRFQELIDECEQLAETYKCKYFPYGKNRGNGCSHNQAIQLAYGQYNCDIYIGGSQDVYFNTKTAFDEWIEKCIPYLDSNYMVSNADAPPPKPAPFAFTIYTKFGFDQVGCLDENFFPAQYEDMDFHRRCCFAMKGKNEDFWNNSYREDVLSDSSHPGMLSRTDMSLAVQQFYVTSPLNEIYYVRKWGGLPGHEKFDHPFNNTSIQYKIASEDCRSPYGEQYDRKDQGIVRI